MVIGVKCMISHSVGLEDIQKGFDIAGGAQGTAAWQCELSDIHINLSSFS